MGNHTFKKRREVEWMPREECLNLKVCESLHSLKEVNKWWVQEEVRKKSEEILKEGYNMID